MILDLDKSVYQNDDISDKDNSINAVFCDSYRISYAFILSQTPTSKTINRFWRMIHYHKVSTIISLSDHKLPYWPSSSNNRYVYGSSLAVSLTTTEKAKRNKHISIHKLKIEDMMSNANTDVEIWHLGGWVADNAFEKNRSDLIDMRNIMINSQLRYTINIHID